MLPQQRFCSCLNCFLVRARTRAAIVTHSTEVYVQSYSHAKFKQYAVDWYLGAHPVTRRGGAAFGGAAPAAEMDRS